MLLAALQITCAVASQNMVCKFLGQGDDDMRQAWALFAKGKPHLDAEEFKKTLALMGEDVEEDEATIPAPVYLWYSSILHQKLRACRADRGTLRNG